MSPNRQRFRTLERQRLPPSCCSAACCTPTFSRVHSPPPPPDTQEPSSNWSGYGLIGYWILLYIGCVLLSKGREKTRYFCQSTPHFFEKSAAPRPLVQSPRSETQQSTEWSVRSRIAIKEAGLVVVKGGWCTDEGEIFPSAIASKTSSISVCRALCSQ